MEINWFIPTNGSDGRYLGTDIGTRKTDIRYLEQIAHAIDTLGFAGALLPTGRGCEDAWITAARLAAITKRMKFIVAFRPGLITPALAARQAATFDRISNGRLIVNIVTGGSDADAAADGVFADKEERYAITDEFLTIYRRVLSGEPEVTFSGDHLTVQKAHNIFPPVQQPYPPIYFGGSSDAGHRTAAKHADVYLTWGEPPQQVAEQIATVRRYAAEAGHPIRFGIRLHIIVRETASEAWDAANDLIKHLDDKTIQAAQRQQTARGAVGQQRMQALHGGRRDKLEVSPNLWAGIGLIRSGAGTALVGDADTVAQRILEYTELGIESFILSGYPHLEEAYRTAELLFPKLPADFFRKPAQNGAHDQVQARTSFEFAPQQPLTSPLAIRN